MSVQLPQICTKGWIKIFLVPFWDRLITSGVIDYSLLFDLEALIFWKLIGVAFLIHLVIFFWRIMIIFFLYPCSELVDLFRCIVVANTFFGILLRPFLINCWISLVIAVRQRGLGRSGWPRINNGVPGRTRTDMQATNHLLMNERAC